MVNRRMDKDDLDSIVWSIIFNRRWASNKNGALWEWCRACHGNVAKENLGHSVLEQKRSSIQKLESVSRLGRAGPDFGPNKKKMHSSFTDQQKETRVSSHADTIDTSFYILVYEQQIGFCIGWAGRFNSFHLRSDRYLCCPCDELDIQAIVFNTSSFCQWCFFENTLQRWFAAIHLWISMTPLSQCRGATVHWKV